jgi:hypothetical protein
MDEDSGELPLFSGPHIPQIRFASALERLDFDAALVDTPAQLRDAVAAIAEAVGRRGMGGVDVDALCRAHADGWPAALERAWQRVVGRSLDAHGVPGVLGEELAASFLLRAGERERAASSVRRHLSYHPRDVRGWRVLAEFEPVRAAARCAFHGGPILDAAGDLLDAVAEDEVAPVADWLLAYAWLARAVGLDELAAALAAEGILAAPPMPMVGDGRAFTWFLLDAGGRPLGAGSKGVVAARERLQRISPVAYRRYLRRAARAG